MKKAFTIAEVLITLGVIGVVAALTIPSLIENHKKKVVAAKLQKFYNTFTTALELSKSDHGDCSEWSYSYEDKNCQSNSEYKAQFFSEYIIKYMKGIKECGPEVRKCANIIVPEEISHYNPNGFSYLRYIFSDGSCFGMTIGGIGIDKRSANIHGFFDYNCGNPPNKAGRDVFVFWTIPGYYPFQYGNPETKINRVDRNTLKTLCKNKPAECGLLIQYDNWEVKEDYPLKL